MRAALLSLIETVPGGSALRGALPLANGRLAMAHVDLARLAGAEEIMCLVDAVDGRVREIERYAASSGLDMHLVRSVADISVRLASDDELLIIADGLYLTRAAATDLARESGSFVATFAPGDGARALAERFERIDINHVWAGLACVRARDLVEARDLPADWSVQSALLRLAVQRGYRRRVLPLALAESGQLALIRDAGEAEALAVQDLGGAAGAGAAALARSGPMRALASRAWRTRWSGPVLRGIAVLTPVIGVGLAVADWSMTALAILIAGRGAGHASDLLFGRFLGNTTGRAERTGRDIGFGLAFAAVTVLAVAASDRLAGLFAAIMLLGLALVLARMQGPIGTRRVGLATSPSLIAFAALVAIPFGALLPALMVWNLILLGFLLWQSRADGLAPRPG